MHGFTKKVQATDSFKYWLWFIYLPRCLKHDNSFTCAIFKPDFHNFLLEYNPARDTFVMGMVFSANLAMIKMYQVQNVYIVDIILGGDGSLQHSEINRLMCGYLSLSSISTKFPNNTAPHQPPLKRGENFKSDGQ